MSASAPPLNPTVPQSRPTLAALAGALRASWTADTSSETEWTPSNPTLGQCAVTALVVQDYYGGGLLRAVVPTGSHYWGLLDDGTEVDLTCEQFAVFSPVSPPQPRTRDHVLSNPDTVCRYRMLAARVRTALTDRA